MAGYSMTTEELAQRLQASLGQRAVAVERYTLVAALGEALDGHTIVKRPELLDKGVPK